MKQDTKLGTYESVALIVTLTITKALISAPTLYVAHSKSAGWMEVLLSGLFELLVLYVILQLSYNFPKADIIDIARYSLGNGAAVITGVLSTCVIIISTAAVFRSFGELVRNTIMRSVSYEYISFFLLAAGISAAYLGLKTQINVNCFIAPIIIISVCIIFFIDSSRYSLTNIQPFLGVGMTKITQNALLKNASFFEIGIILFLFPYFSDKSSVKRISFTALLVSIAVIVSITLVYQLSVPYEAAETFAMPLYQMTRMIKANTFFQRIEPLNMFLWSGAMFLYISTGIWLCTHVCKKTFLLSDNRPLVFIFSAIICLLALIPGSETSVEKIFDFLITYSYIAYPILPLILLLLASAFKNKGEVNL